jgi:uncharacterized protein
MPASPTLGAPGIYPAPPEPDRRYRTVPLDTCAFVGLAPRGPARVPQLDELGQRLTNVITGHYPTYRSEPRLVHSWDEYRWLYGGFEGGSLLPQAVSAFFRQGGRRAWVVRIVHDYGFEDSSAERGRAVHWFADLAIDGAEPLRVCARNEGSWGNRLRLQLDVSLEPLRVTIDVATLDPIHKRFTVRPSPGERPEEFPARGDLLALIHGGKRTLAAVDQAHALTGGVVAVQLDDWWPEAWPDTPVLLERITGRLRIDDLDPTIIRTETYEHLGFHPAHERHLVTFVDDRSDLVAFDPAARDSVLWPSEATAARIVSQLQMSGIDRNADIDLSDFCPPDWQFDGEFPDYGIFCLAHLDTRHRRVDAAAEPTAVDRNARVAMLCAPDLARVPVARREPVATKPQSLAGAAFADCVDPINLPPDDSLGELQVMNQAVSDLTRSQQAVVRFAEQRREFVVLLDAPAGLGTRQVLEWRRNFDSAFAAAYHPWPFIAQASPNGSLSRVLTPPSAFAAGVIASRELHFGFPWGPANDFLVGGVGVERRVPPNEHDELHLAGVNVLIQEPSGVLLTAARTLSRDPSYRQLSVRRLMTMLRIALDEQSQWLVFEPNNPALRAWLQHSLEAYLEDLYAIGAFVGSTRSEAFFVRAGDDVNTFQAVDRGQLIVEVGVAPVEPIEYLVLRIAADNDGLIQVEERRG